MTTITSPIQKIESILQKIKGYSPQWISMISSKPLIFEDIEYFMLLHYVENVITPEELAAYNNGMLRRLYSSFETMLMDNIEYYDRIITYCMMHFLNRYSMDGKSYENVPDHIIHIDTTPTKIWCAAMISPSSTKWEQEYGLDLSLPKDTFENNFKYIKKNHKLFDFFISQRAYVNNTRGFRETLLHDKISTIKYYQICKKFTKSTNAVGSNQLDSVSSYIAHTDNMTRKLYDSLSKCLKSLYNRPVATSLRSPSPALPYSIHIFNDDFYINTEHFAIRVHKFIDTKTNKESISKDYLSNSYECFIAETYFKGSIKQQIEWCRYKIPPIFSDTLEMLQNLLYKLLCTNYRDVICIKYSSNLTSSASTPSNDTAIITFSGVFDNVYLTTTLKHGKSIVHKYTKCLSKMNATKYIIRNGYYIFGYTEDVTQLLNIINNDSLTKEEIQDAIKNHLLKYSLDIRIFMKDIISAYQKYNTEIISAYNGNIPEDSETSYITLDNINALTPKDIIKSINKSVNKSLHPEQTRTKSYFQIINA
jgi:hypothetical protein